MISRLCWSATLLVCLSGAAHAGFIEICKDSNPSGSLSGLFSFTVAGQSGTFSAPVGACTSDFLLPDGPAFITELPQPGATLVDVTTFPSDRLDTFNLALGTAQVETVAGDISNETVVTFVNAPVLTSIPEPGSGWLIGLGCAFWVLRRNWPKRLFN